MRGCPVKNGEKQSGRAQAAPEECRPSAFLLGASAGRPAAVAQPWTLLLRWCVRHGKARVCGFSSAKDPTSQAVRTVYSQGVTANGHSGFGGASDDRMPIGDGRPGVGRLSDRATSPQKTRVTGFCDTPLGRLSRRHAHRPINRPDSRACDYKTASGLRGWPNRDPWGEAGFEGTRGRGFSVGGIPAEAQEGPNPYRFVRNDSLNSLDADGGQLIKLPLPRPVTPLAPVVVSPIGTAIVCGCFAAAAIDIASSIIWPTPSCSPLPFPFPTTTCFLSPVSPPGVCLYLCRHTGNPADNQEVRRKPGPNGCPDTIVVRNPYK